MPALFPLLLALIAAAAPARSQAPVGATHTTSTGIELVRVEPGRFTMGQTASRLPDALVLPLSYPTRTELDRRFPQGDPEAFLVDLEHVRGGDFDERPAHPVSITRPFYMGVTEVTNAQYEQFDPSHRQRRGELGFSTGDDEAVVFVSWHDAVTFTEWLSEREGLPYRLPTEAEWEYACRAGTTTAFHTGDALPEAFHRNPRRTQFREPEDVVALTVGRTPANPWGLHDMHGNVEEWVLDWYGPYPRAAQADPVGHADGDFKVTRGGSHGTNLYYLRSANRQGTLPENEHWLIGFRVVLGELPDAEPLPEPPLPLHQRGVSQRVVAVPAGESDAERPFFRGPRRYVKIPEGSHGPLFSHHNHDAAITEAPNGDLLAIWYTCVEERGREVAVAASRLRHGADEWDEASLFWDAPDRNDHCPALWTDEAGTLYHLNGLSVAGMWSPLAVVLRTSTDSGATWSRGRLIVPEHGHRQMVGEPVFRTRDGAIAFGADADGGSALWISRDGGATWSDPGGTIAGIHAGIAERDDGSLIAFGRGQNVDGFLPRSVSTDGGRTWEVSASPFPPIGGGQRLVLLKLEQGPLFLASFARDPWSTEPTERPPRHVARLFGALSYDGGETWPVRRILAGAGEDRPADSFDGAPILMNEGASEPKGYLSVAQARDGTIHLITSWNHYAFNSAWLEQEMPPPSPAPAPRPLLLREALRVTDPAWQDAETGAPGPRIGPGGLQIDRAGDGSRRWSNERLGGLHEVDVRSGLTAEIDVRVLASGPTGGVELELYARGGPLTVNHYRIDVTRDAVRYWYDGGWVSVAEGLDNADRPHSYRLAVRPDTAVQIYRDERLLATHATDLIIDWRAPARGTYVAWGAAEGAEALVTGVAWDASGAYRPLAAPERP